MWGEVDMNIRLLTLVFALGALAAAAGAQTIVQQHFAISNRPEPTSDMDLTTPTKTGSMLIAMPAPRAPGVKVESVTDNAPGGSNTYKQVPEAASSCGKTQSLDIWYCENCKGGVTELKFHLASGARLSVNSFLELANMQKTSALDGTGAHVNDGTRTAEGVEVGPSITTTATDFVIAKYYSSNPIPTAVTPTWWTYKTTYVYATDLPPGTHQPKLTGPGTGGEYCMSMAAFQTAPHH